LTRNSDFEEDDAELVISAAGPTKYYIYPEKNNEAITTEIVTSLWIRLSLYLDQRLRRP